RARDAEVSGHDRARRLHPLHPRAVDHEGRAPLVEPDHGGAARSHDQRRLSPPRERAIERETALPRPRGARAHAPADVVLTAPIREREPRMTRLAPDLRLLPRRDAE